jgi:predicted permease
MVLSNVIVNIFIPCLVFTSMLTDLDDSQLENLVLILGFSIGKS